VVDAIDNARSVEGLPPMTLPSNWTSLDPAEQLFVGTDLERVVRGLAPLSALSSALDDAATSAAIAGTDPSPPAGFPASRWGGNSGQFVGSPLEVLYYWMYDDGPGSPNIDCSTTNSDGCFGHRLNVLLALACTPCVAGASWVALQDDRGNATELIVETSGSLTVDFTWAEEQQYLTTAGA
jgi:hypothetical protein